MLLDILGDKWLRESRQSEPYAAWILRNLTGRARTVGRFRSGSHPEIEEMPMVRTPVESRVLAVHHLWYILIQDYSLRYLTKATDRLPALSGLANHFPEARGVNAQYVAGIWTDDLNNGLCWRRTLTAGIDPLVADAEDYVAPSFSWASSQGPIIFKLPMSLGEWLEGLCSTLS